MVTADNITEEQIRELLLNTPLFGNREHEVVAYAALYPARTPGARKAVRAARARCAEILNARNGANLSECSTCGAVHGDGDGPDDVDCFGVPNRARNGAP